MLKMTYSLLHSILYAVQGNLVDYIRNMVRSEAHQTKNIGAVDSSSKTSSDSGDAKTDKEKLDSNSDFGSDNEEGEFDPEQEVEKALDHGGDKHVDTDGIRRERNRMHAKLTRDRKKLFTSRVQQMIKSLERQNSFMRKRLESIDKTTGTSFLGGT